MNLNHEFSKAIQRLQENPKIVETFSPSSKLRLYGLFKQATTSTGERQLPETSFFAFLSVAEAQNQAWHTESCFSPDEAKREYVQLVSALFNDKSQHQENTQLISVIIVLLLIPLTFCMVPVSLLLLLFPLTSVPMGVYLVYIAFVDDSAYTGNRIPFLRNWNVLRHFVNYFPVSLHRKSPVLNPQKRYVFAYHPHGVIGLGCFSCFATNFAGFTEQFPGVSLKLLTLHQNFYVPFMREVLLALGMASCDKRACQSLLQNGHSICLIVGGARESLEQNYSVVLSMRRGFVRAAIENRALLVPVIGFGETDAFETIHPSPLAKRCQLALQRWVGITLPFFWGRSFVPQRGQIHVVTGPALDAKLLFPTLDGEELVEHMHAAYVAALTALFDEYKDTNEAGIKRKASLIIM